MRTTLRALTVLATVFAWWVAPPAAQAQGSAALTVDDASVVPGQVVRVQGTCVPAGAQDVPVELREAAVHPLGQLGAQPDGSFGGEVTVPLGVPTGVRAELVALCPSGELGAPVAIIEGGLQPMGASTLPEDVPAVTQAVPVGGVEAGAGGTAAASPSAGVALGVLVLFAGLAAAARRPA